MEKEMKHNIERTSPKGGLFIGTCVLCGSANLRFSDVTQDCPNQRGLTEDESLLHAIKPVEH